MLMFKQIEKQFAVKVVQHMETYWNILEKVKGSQLRLTKMDDEIYEDFMKTFPEFDPAATLNEDEMKSKEGKEKWRNWMMQYEKRVDDYNFGTMLRKSAKDDYSQDSVIFAVRMQFYAIEIARLVMSVVLLTDGILMKYRNKAGLNDWIYEKAQSGSK